MAPRATVTRRPMTPAEREHCRGYDNANTEGGVGCFLIAAVVLAVLFGGIGLLIATVSWARGEGFHLLSVWRAVYPVSLICFALAIVVAFFGRVVRPIRRRLDPRGAEYVMVDEVQLIDAEAYACYDPVGHEIETHHGKHRVFEHEYLLVIAPGVVFHFDQQSRGDIPIWNMLTADGREDPFSAFPAECRIVYRARDGMLMDFAALGPLVDIVGSYYESKRPPAVARWLKERRKAPLVMRGDIGRPAELEPFAGGFLEALVGSPTA